MVIFSFINIWNNQFKTNAIVYKLLLTGNKFIPGLHLRQSALTYNACGALTKHRKRYEKFRETVGLKYIYKNE